MYGVLILLHYLDLVEGLDGEPDEALLNPIFEAFEAMESGGETGQSAGA
jgi:hypothetical protein